MRIAALLAGASLGLVAAREARADGPAQAFPLQGHLAVSNDADVSFTYAWTSFNGGGSSSTTTFNLRPAADYFVIDGLSVGGFVLFQYESISPPGGGSSANLTSFGIGPRVGYDIPLSDQFSFWPRGGFAIESVGVSVPVALTGGGSTTSTSSTTVFALLLDAPFLFHPAEHFFLGLGPTLTLDLTGDVKTNVFGVDFIIGGYFGK